MKLFLKRLLAYLPTSLPVGKTAYHKWADSILELTGPIADTNSLKWALSIAVLHSGETESSKPKIYFVRKLLKGAANQVASQVIQDIKTAQQASMDAANQLEMEKQKEKITAEHVAQAKISPQAADLSRGKQPQVEATTESVVAPNG